MIAPYNYVEPRVRSSRSSIAADINNSTENVQSRTIPNDWSESEIAIAVAEAKERYERPLDRNVTI